MMQQKVGHTVNRAILAEIIACQSRKLCLPGTTLDTKMSSMSLKNTGDCKTTKTDKFLCLYMHVNTTER